MKETFSVLVDRQVDDCKICKIAPVNVEHNCTFIIDQSKLKHPGDICADDCGMWKNNGVRPCVVNWKNNDATITARGSGQCNKYEIKPDDYTIYRTYYIHKSYGDFRKVISIIHGMILFLYTCI